MFHKVASVIPLVAVTAVLAAQAPAPALRIVAPDADTVLSGPALFAVDVTSMGSGVAEVIYYVDGREACRSNRPPFRCSWDAGLGANERHVRAVAVLESGARVSAALRTAGIDVSETVSVAAVTVSAHVTDYRGRFVPGLQRGDFRLFEDGEAQEVASLATQEQPVELVVALDVSGSMAPNFDALKQTVNGFLKRLRERDVVTVAAFNTGLFVLAPRTAAPAAREAAVSRMRSWGGTALYDAMIRACDLLKEPVGRKALVIFTDGDDVSSRGSPEAARAALQANDVVLYVIGQARAAEDKHLRERLETLAEETGGAAFFGSKPSALNEHFEAVMENLTNQYVLSYVPRRPLGDGKWREIRVELSGRRHKVRSRQGYFASAGALR